MDKISPGLYLASPNGELTALHTADGKGDERLLLEYIEEWDLKGIEVTLND